MRVLGFNWFPLASILAFFILLPLGVEGQLRTVVSNEIAVSENEATLRLDFQDSGGLTISLLDGQVLVDGDVMGSFSRRDGLDLAWRSLLGDVITLDDGPLALALNDWDPPRSLTGGAENLAARLDQTLEEALEGTPINDFILKIGEDVVVGAGEEIKGTLILVDGDLDVRGRIDGDVVVTGGTVRLLDDGFITGDLRIADGKLERSGGSVGGSFLELDTGDRAQLEAGELDDLRREMESEIRRDLRSTLERENRPSPNIFLGFLGNLGGAIAGLLENLVTFLVLATLGVLAVHFQRERLEVISTTAHRAPARSAVVGLAGGFFLIPIWIVGTIALAITIIGIPALLVWVPLFPIAAGLAILLGFLAVARNVGEWVAEQEYRGLEWIRGSNTFYTVIAGVGALMVPCIAASAVRILGFGFLTGLLGFVGSLVTFAAASVGLGAVLLTRGGKIRPLESYSDFEEDYWADMDSGEPERSASEPAPEESPTPEEGPIPEESPTPEETPGSEEGKDEHA